MTSDELEAEAMRQAAAMVADFTEELKEHLKDVKPLTPSEIEAIAKRAHETDPELQRMDAEIRQLKAVDTHLPGESLPPNRANQFHR